MKWKMKDIGRISDAPLEVSGELLNRNGGNNSDFQRMGGNTESSGAVAAPVNIPSQNPSSSNRVAASLNCRDPYWSFL